MATPYVAPLPPDTDLTAGCTVEFVALDPATGNAVSGVTVANISIYADTTGSAELVPTFEVVTPVLIPSKGRV
jgi:hypothetical protein